jgi:hypothetical protein
MGKIVGALIFMLAIGLLGSIHYGIDTFANIKPKHGQQSYAKSMRAPSDGLIKIEYGKDYYDLSYFCTFFSVLSVVLAWLVLYRAIHPQGNKKYWWFTAFLVVVFNFSLPYFWNVYYKSKVLINGDFIKGFLPIPLPHLLPYAIGLMIVSFIIFLILSLPIIIENFAHYNSRTLSLFIYKRGN